MKVLQGVGAASVEYLVHSPMIRQSHFQRVILMSGSMFSSWSRVHNPSDRAARLATALGCPLPADLHTHHTNIVDCLRSETNIISSQNKLLFIQPQKLKSGSIAI